MENSLTKEKMLKFEETYDEILNKASTILSILVKEDPKKYKSVCVDQITSINSDWVSVGGWDGCRGCYDFESESIPTHYFYDNDWLQDALKRKKEREDKEDLDRQQQIEQNKVDREIYERQEYERLNKKFGNGVVNCNDNE